MKNKIGIVIIVILIGAIGLYIYNDLHKIDSSVEVNNATTTLSGLGIDFEGDGITVEQVPIEDIKQPSFDRKISFPQSFSLEAQEIIKKKIADAVALLKEDPNRVDKWMEYASYLNALNDHIGAVEVWEYTALLAPNTPEIYANLGFTYGYDLKNPAKGEENFLIAISLSSRDPLYYVQTAQFYIDIVKDNQKALAIVNKGLVNVPNDENLLKLKAKLEK